MEDEKFREEVLARLKAIEEVRLPAIMAEVNILTKARTTPKQTLIFEKIQDGRKSLSTDEAMHFAQCTRQTALDALKHKSAIEPDKYRFVAGDPATKIPSRIICRDVQAKPINFDAICDGKTKFSLRELAKNYGRELAEVKELANSFCQTSGKYRFHTDQYDNVSIIPKV
jgi:hypothetical protein